MKFRAGLFIAALCALITVRAAEPTIEFAGVLTNEGHTKLALTNKASGTTRWVEPGEVFFGYTLARYDEEHEAVYLRKGGQETRLALISGKSPAEVAANTATPAASASTPAAPSTEAAANAIRGNLRMLAAAARRVQAERGPTTVTYADLVGPDKPIRELRPVAGESYAHLAFPATVGTVSVTMADGAPISVEMPATSPATVASTLAAQNPPATPTSSAQTPTAPTTVINVTPPAAATAVTTSPENTAAASPPSSPGSENQSLEPTGRAPTAPSYTTGSVGETWESISQKTGVPVTRLKELNSPIPSGSSLPQGQTIRLR